jgi:hypothetical protein
VKAWDFRTGAYYELLTKKEAVARGWAESDDDILGVRLTAAPIVRESFMCRTGIFVDGFDFLNGPMQSWDRFMN